MSAALSPVADACCTPSSELHFVHLTGAKNFSDSYRFLNYDGHADTHQSNRDWPITMVFWNNASIRRVYNVLKDPPYGWYSSGGTEYEGYRPHTTDRTSFHGERGVKSDCTGARDSHIRVYGNGHTQRMYDPSGYGYFVVASTHYDHGEAQCNGGNKWFGLSESVEAQVRKIFQDSGYYVYDEYFNLHNHEHHHHDKHSSHHIWQSSGRATGVSIP